MNAILFATLAAAAAAATAAPPDWETANCNDHDLQVMLSAPKARRLQNRMEVERRFAVVLHAEREHVRALGAPRGGLGQALLPAALALCGLLGVLAGVARRSRALAAAGVVPLLAATLVAAVPMARARAGQETLAAFKECRLRLLDTRAQILLSELATALDDLSEAEEDLLGWETRVQNGERIALPEIQKLRKEVSRVAR